MNKKIFITVLCLIVFFLVAQTSQAVLVRLDTGTLRSEVFTDLDGADLTTPQEWYENSQEVVDSLTELSVTKSHLAGEIVGTSTSTSGYAEGEYRRANGGAQLRINTEATAGTGASTTAFTSVVNVTSVGRLKFDIMIDHDLDGGIFQEYDGDYVRLDAESVMSGSLNAMNFGSAHLEFYMDVYETATSTDAVMSVTWDEIAQGPWAMINLANEDTKTDFDIDHFDIGESFYVEVGQKLTTYSNGMAGSAGIASAVQSVDDLYAAISFEARTGGDTDPVPEPASFLLLGIGLLGFGLSDKIKKILPKKNS